MEIIEKNSEKIYASVDLKSFYASVECIERGLDSMDTNLVVADISRTAKTICLAVSPSLKEFKVPGRPRLFEVESIIKKINASKTGKKKSYIYSELKKDNTLKVDYIIAKPKMALYIDYSNKIYEIYLKYFSKEDIYVYSVDEVFIDLTPYIKIYNKNPIDIISTVIKDIKKTVGIVATAGIGTNMYLSKVAMDILAKRIKDKENKIAYLDENLYKKNLWNHRPITDFWRIGINTAKKLEKIDLYTMGDIARLSLGKKTDYHNEDLLFNIFGINAELLIDHAWGIEPTTIKDIKSYIPKSNSFSNSQVLSNPYSFDKARVIVREMSENLILDMISSNLLLKSIILYIDYDTENILKNNNTRQIKIDYYGREVPKPFRASFTFNEYTNNLKNITDKFLELYDGNNDKQLSIRRITIILDKLKDESKSYFKQLSLFDQDDIDKPLIIKSKKNRCDLDKALVNLKRKYGKNSVLKCNSLLEESTIIDRNKQIGGHKA